MSQKAVLDKWQLVSLLFSSLIDPAVLVPEIEEQLEALQDSRSPERGERTWFREDEDGKKTLVKERMHYCGPCGVDRDASVCPEFGADRAQR
jgi:hypothetical protein